MAQQFTVDFDTAGFGHNISTRINFIPRTWSDTDMGGPETADIDVVCQREELAHVFWLLARKVTIQNAFGTRVWHGVVHEIEVLWSGVRLIVSLENVTNAVRVAYVKRELDGKTNRYTTPWATDGASISRYGRRERLLSLGEATEEAALALRDQSLRFGARPQPQVEIGDGEVGGVTAVIHCQGPIHEAYRRYWENAKGLLEYTAMGSAKQGIGAYYRNTTISFEERDDIMDSANKLGALQKEVQFQVRGATVTTDGNGNVDIDNNHKYTVATHKHAGHIEVTTKGIRTQNAGPLVTLSRDGDARDMIAQRFTLPSDSGSWEVHKVAIQVQKTGPVTDNLIVDIRADAAGIPGTILESKQLAPSAVASYAVTWAEIEFANTTTLWPNTSYWVVVRRADGPQYNGDARLGRFYTVGVNDNLDTYANTCLVYNGASWIARDPECRMPFRITGAETITGQSSSMLQYLSGVTFTTVFADSHSAQLVPNHHNGDRLIGDILESYLSHGYNNGDRMLLAFDDPGVAKIYRRPEFQQSRALIVGDDGRVRLPAGAPYEPGKLIAGKWVELEFLPLLDSMEPMNNRIFVARSQYEVASDLLSFEVEGQTPPWEQGVENR
jgi:hypothetical protein